MFTRTMKPKASESRSVASSIAQRKRGQKQVAGIVDNRPKGNLEKIQRHCAQLLQAESNSSSVVQFADSYYPDVAEPHIHEHNGGITFTDIGHNHRDLQAGDQIRHNVIQDVMLTLQGYGTARANQIITWIENQFNVQAPEAEVEEEYDDPNITAEWLEAEQEDHNPEGHAPRDFQYQGGRGDGVGFA